MKLLRIVAALALGAGTLAVPAMAQTAHAATPVVPITAPPMGWNSWNKFGCNIDENLIRGTADAIVANNLDDLGYVYVNIDDCWMASTRDSQGRLQAHPTRFPSGIKALADYVHARGLKLGIYSSAGSKTCQGLPASLGHELIDAQTWAAWEIDFLKYDNCNHDGTPAMQRYKAMGDALKSVSRPIVYSICNWGEETPWLFAPLVGGSLWRTTGDISDSWGSMTSLLDQQVSLEPFARKDGFNDPDMLEVGNGGMTTTEYTAHFSLWALLNSPMLLGNDLRSMSSATLGIIRNADVVAVNQDWGGSQGRKIKDLGETEVWAKPMADGSVAVVLFNRTGASATVTTSAAEIGVGGSSAYQLKDLWSKAVTSTSGAISASVPAHGAVMFRVTRNGTAQAAPAAGSYQVGDMAWLASTNGWGPAERNKSNREQAAGDGGTLTINGTTYAKGVGVHADSGVHVWLGRACPLFTAQVGVDDEVSNAAASVRFQVYGDGKLLAYSAVKTASQGPTTMSVATGGYSTLELRVTDGRSNGISYDHADWGAATLTCTSAGTGAYVSDRTWTSSTNGWGPAERDQSNAEQPSGDGVVPTVGGVSYVKGLGVHAGSDIALSVSGCSRFTAVAGVDAEAASGSVSFTVIADGATIYTSPTVTTTPVAINVDISGRSQLRLVTDDGGNGISFDHGDWADARLVC